MGAAGIVRLSADGKTAKHKEDVVLMGRVTELMVFVSLIPYPAVGAIIDPPVVEA